MSLVVDIHKKLPGFQLDVSFNVENSALGLLGPSGSGKSMTLRCIAGLQKPDRGHISIGGQVLFDSEQGINLPPQQRKIGLLFQNYALFPHLTIKNNIAMGLRGIEEKESKTIIQEMVAMIKLDGLEERYPHQLSGGQQQRAALARALAPRPEVLLMDEPFSALDNHLRGEMEQEIRTLLSTFPATAVFVTHNLDEAYRLCQTMLILEKGKVAASGSKDAIINAPPTLDVARMIGCQNLSRFTWCSGSKVEALDWGCTLQLPAEKISPKTGHIGIYSNHIRLAEKNENVNIIDCQIIEIVESPHHATISFKLLKSINKGFFKVSFSKEKWYELGQKELQLVKLYLPPEKLFLTMAEL